MPKKRRIRRFIITIEEVDAGQVKREEITHQAIPPLQTREGWLERQELPPRRRRRPRSNEG